MPTCATCHPAQALQIRNLVYGILIRVDSASSIRWSCENFIIPNARDRARKGHWMPDSLMTIQLRNDDCRELFGSSASVLSSTICSTRDRTQSRRLSPDLFRSSTLLTKLFQNIDRTTLTRYDRINNSILTYHKATYRPFYQMSRQRHWRHLESHTSDLDTWEPHQSIWRLESRTRIVCSSESQICSWDVMDFHELVSNISTILPCHLLSKVLTTETFNFQREVYARHEWSEQMRWRHADPALRTQFR